MRMRNGEAYLANDTMVPMGQYVMQCTIFFRFFEMKTITASPPIPNKLAKIIAYSIGTLHMRNTIVTAITSSNPAILYRHVCAMGV
jgi:hypothetical protein